MGKVPQYDNLTFVVSLRLGFLSEKHVNFLLGNA